MKVLVGLGNPGSQYEQTRHNAGFRVIDLIATSNGAQLKVDKNLQAAVLKGKFKGHDVVLAKPLTYMNLSGHAVQRILHWFKVESKDLLVIHDDVSLPLGKMRLQSAGGAGGQHGVESIIEQFGGNKNFDRLKVGVGPDPGGDLRASFVLSGFHGHDLLLFDKVVLKAAEASLSWLQNGTQKTANRYNGIDLAAPPEEKKPKAKANEQAKDQTNHTTEESTASNGCEQTSQSQSEPSVDAPKDNRTTSGK